MLRQRQMRRVRTHTVDVAEVYVSIGKLSLTLFFSGLAAIFVNRQMKMIAAEALLCYPKASKTGWSRPSAAQK
jgi:hypothetical protein